MAAEIEAKFLNIDHSNMRRTLRQNGFKRSRSERKMRRQLFAIPGTDNLVKWGRVRDEGHQVTMTVKHAVDVSRIDGTDEIEMISKLNFYETIAFIEAWGPVKHSYQETTREDWTRGQVTVSLDCWPGLKPDMEIEAPDERQVRNAALDLGLDWADAVFGNIMHVYHLELGIPLEAFKRIHNITFEDPPKRWGT